jgi:hypothetical protein
VRSCEWSIGPSAAFEDGELLIGYTSLSFSIMTCSSLVQSNQKDSAVLVVKVTMQYINEEKF